MSLLSQTSCWPNSISSSDFTQDSVLLMQRVLLNGTFTPAAACAAAHKSSAYRAANLRRSRCAFPTPPGLPRFPTTQPEANPRGLAIRFNLAEHVHTDIVSHSTDGFPAHDGYEFLEFLRAVSASGPDVPSPKPIEVFLSSHPAALAFVQAPKPFPSSFARDSLFWRHCICVHQRRGTKALRPLSDRARRRQ